MESTPIVQTSTKALSIQSICSFSKYNKFFLCLGHTPIQNLQKDPLFSFRLITDKNKQTNKKTHKHIQNHNLISRGNHYHYILFTDVPFFLVLIMSGFPIHFTQNHYIFMGYDLESCLLNFAGHEVFFFLFFY